MMTDPLADMLTRIRNGQLAKLIIVPCPYSKLKENVLKVFLEEGYIKSYSIQEVRQGIKNLRIELKYFDGQPVIKEINRISKPGRRVCSKVKDLKPYMNGLGISVISTPNGVMSSHKATTGGEILCQLY